MRTRKRFSNAVLAFLFWGCVGFIAATTVVFALGGTTFRAWLEDVALLALGAALARVLRRWNLEFEAKMREIDELERVLAEWNRKDP